jgi:hypothetical protein
VSSTRTYSANQTGVDRESIRMNSIDKKLKNALVSLNGKVKVENFNSNTNLWKNLNKMDGKS